ncbi:MAG TPA: hypothetical protein VIL00_07905 [Pseudonocardiaceae bacterium]
MTRLSDLTELLVLGFGLIGAGLLCLALPHLVPLLAAPPRPARGRVHRPARHRARPGALTVADLHRRLAATAPTGGGR